MLTTLVCVQNKSYQEFDANVGHANQKFVPYSTGGKRSQSALESLPCHIVCFRDLDPSSFSKLCSKWPRELPALLRVTSPTGAADPVSVPFGVGVRPQDHFPQAAELRKESPENNHPCTRTASTLIPAHTGCQPHAPWAPGLGGSRPLTRTLEET